MKKSLLIAVMGTLLILLLAGCGCDHEWLAATCTAPKTCQLCGETEGESLGHTWQDASCIDPKTCTVCKATEGEALGHTWQDATCIDPKTCTVCKATEGEALGHTWQDATCIDPKTCTVCKATEGEALGHTWQDATCVDPKTCTVCKATEGEALGHTWQDATCVDPKTCTVCKATEGEALGHAWQNATCTTPKTCTVCKITEGNALGHAWKEATTEAPKTCSNCNLTEGSKLITDPRFTTKDTKFLHGTWTCEVPLTKEMLGFDGVPDGLCYIFTMKFGKTGQLVSNVTVNDEQAYMAVIKEYTIELTYQSLEEQGISRNEANQAMLEIYGLTVEEYVEASMAGMDVNQLLGAVNMEEVYYVQDGAIYTGLTWDSKFEKSTYTLKNGILTVEGMTMEDGIELMQWKKTSNG